MNQNFIALFIFFLIFAIFSVIYFVTYGVNYFLKNRLRNIFGETKCKLFSFDSDDNLLSPLIKKDGGDVLLIAEGKNNENILFYTVGVTGKLSNLKYLIVIVDYANSSNEVVGIEYMYRVAKYNRLYEKITFGLHNIPPNLDSNSQYIEAVEFFNNKAYIFYRLPMLGGGQLLDEIAKRYSVLK